ncbi:hypothetical protein L1987_35234 [Smallanthus sonchifolius]|uniref:Uncharacterized protein n=1 Tax=Smallanthus sonchifolius TaxID=185202 RepID=A0ACB9HVB7_9ASTR|nr:hypothetical protein L1987_35234 [Smallanthus sonchifolius]
MEAKEFKDKNDGKEPLPPPLVRTEWTKDYARRDGRNEIKMRLLCGMEKQGIWGMHPDLEMQMQTKADVQRDEAGKELRGELEHHPIF